MFYTSNKLVTLKFLSEEQLLRNKIIILCLVDLSKENTEIVQTSSLKLRYFITFGHNTKNLLLM